MVMKSRILYGYTMLIIATILWGSSFVFIKLSVENVSAFGYTFYRSFFAVVMLTPVILFKKMRNTFSYRDFIGGIVTGVAYMFGLLLQGLGTRYTLPSTSAFITGLNTVHIHTYCAFVKRAYNRYLLAALVLSLIGLFIVTSPSGGIGLGEILVFFGSIAWAIQILLVSKYSRHSKNYIDFLYGMFIPSLVIAPWTILYDNPMNIVLNSWMYIIYLAIVCSIVASLLQIIGQRYVAPAIASVIYLLEPFFALLFSISLYGEEVDIVRIAGGIMIVLASYIAISYSPDADT